MLAEAISAEANNFSSFSQTGSDSLQYRRIISYRQLRLYRSQTLQGRRGRLLGRQPCGRENSHEIGSANHFSPMGAAP